VSAKVLVVDDEPAIVRAVAANLRARGFEALTVGTGEAALAAVEAHQPDCVVLDLGLPGVAGLEVLRRLRTWTDVPVVVLTAVDSERDKVTALDLGADDYVTKPFGIAELMARVRVALRHGRTAAADRPRVIHAQDAAIDLDAKLVTRAGSPVRLTATEYRLLEVLATNPGRLCTHRYLLERVWGPGYGEESQYLRVYVANLRRKLDDPSDPRILLTEPGMGYRFVAEGPGELKSEAPTAVVGDPPEPSGSSPVNQASGELKNEAPTRAVGDPLEPSGSSPANKGGS
jgi:two-component system, OmpR family, KDP operon response regulator KdpE